MPTVYLAGKGARWDQDCQQGQGGRKSASRWGNVQVGVLRGVGGRGVMGELAEEWGLSDTGGRTVKPRAQADKGWWEKG